MAHAGWSPPCRHRPAPLRRADRLAARGGKGGRIGRTLGFKSVKCGALRAIRPLQLRPSRPPAGAGAGPAFAPPPIASGLQCPPSPVSSRSPGALAVSAEHVFSGDPLDRADHQRRDDAWVRARRADPASRFLAFANQQVVVRAGPPTSLGWLDVASVERLEADPETVLLGLLGDVAHFALELPPSAEMGLPPGLALADPRQVATEVSRAESGILAHAKSVVDWHARHRFCANCGAPTASRKAGKERACERCDAHHFPRTDPVVIMLVTDGDRCLLGRNARRRNAFYSALAGFVDQGESIEEAVRREVQEEAGIRVGAIRYHSSQPWPFPSSLMIGCHADALSTDIAIDPEELSDCRWFTRAEVRAALAAGASPGEGLRVPGPIAIAHHLIRAWADDA
ncbi:MAG: NAD(+) diphosphatase [Ectothiorhodospiraceae bacterium]|nr:NAD(+) diphosphatase [Chromatiales bacterium]MCP5154083.1 NAD(+) diphosphatase [Ectothiorhodospiraceae bacterium]